MTSPQQVGQTSYSFYPPLFGISYPRNSHTSGEMEFTGKQGPGKCTLLRLYKDTALNGLFEFNVFGNLALVAHADL